MQIDEVAVRPLAESDEDVVHRIRTSVDDAARPSRLEVRQRVGAGARKRRDACERPRRDRKSTRLNSSHLVISYAVFCLKKKKKKKPQQRVGPRTPEHTTP